MKSHKGLFITFEKTAEGLGGTTQTKRLTETLRNLQAEVILTREPGGTPTGEKLRQIMLDPTIDLAKSTELFLMMAIRGQHYKEVLKPNLKQGNVVISDRYFDSTLVYQGAAQGWKTEFLLRLHHATTGMLMPDLTFVLDGIPHRSLRKEDRLESMGSNFHNKVREAMLYYASKSDRYVIVNANQSEDIVAEQILNTVLDRFPKHFSLTD